MHGTGNIAHPSGAWLQVVTTPTRGNRAPGLWGNHPISPLSLSLVSCMAQLARTGPVVAGYEAAWYRSPPPEVSREPAVWTARGNRGGIEDTKTTLMAAFRPLSFTSPRTTRSSETIRSRPRLCISGEVFSR